MRYTSLFIAVFCLIMLFFAESPTVLAICLLGTGLFGFMAVLGFAQAKIESSSQPHFNIMSPQELAEMRQRAIANKGGKPSANATSGSTAGAAYGGSSSGYGDDRRAGDDGNDSSDSGSDGGGGDGGGGGD